MRMKPLKYICSALAVSVFLAGCATPVTSSPSGSKEEVEREVKIQSKMAYERFLLDEARLHDVAYPILVANAGLCPEVTYDDGTRVWSLSRVPDIYRDAAREETGLDERPMIYAVSRGSAADKAGLRVGDRILAFGGKTVPADKNAFKVLNEVLEDNIQNRDIAITVERDGVPQSMTVSRDLLCAYMPVYDPDEQIVNASADGEHILFGRGMLRFAETETELATVVAHEIAHNAMLHIQKQEQNVAMGYAVGLAADLLIAAAGGVSPVSMANSGAQAAAGAYSVEFETEADYVGLYFMARAGYEVSDAANFWRRMASENSSASITREKTHPTSPARYLALEKTSLEIKGKQQAGEALVPAIEAVEPRKTTGKRGFN